jgi:hypothetical protein
VTYLLCATQVYTLRAARPHPAPLLLSAQKKRREEKARPLPALSAPSFARRAQIRFAQTPLETPSLAQSQGTGGRGERKEGSHINGVLISFMCSKVFFLQLSKKLPSSPKALCHFAFGRGRSAATLRRHSLGPIRDAAK